MPKVVLFAALTVISALQAAHSQTITYEWSETGSSPYGDASGTLVIDATGAYDAGDGGYDYNVDDFAGVFTSGQYAGTSFSSSSLPYPANPRGYLVFPTSSLPVPSDLAGASVVFTADSEGDNFDVEGSGPGNYSLSVDEGQDNGGDSFTVSLAAVPESAANPLAIAAAGLFVGWRGLRGVRKARA